MTHKPDLKLTLTPEDILEIITNHLAQRHGVMFEDTYGGCTGVEQKLAPAGHRAAGTPVFVFTFPAVQEDKP